VVAPNHTFTAVPFNQPETLPLTVGTLACITLRRRIEEKLYESISLACSMDGGGVAARVSNALTCFL
jgi:hypothetical protein